MGYIIVINQCYIYALSDNGNQTLYIQSILKELAIEQKEATSLDEDNKSYLHMTQNQKPTMNMRNVNLRNFVVAD